MSQTNPSKMKRIVFGLVALLATSFALPLSGEDRIIGGQDTSIRDHPYVFRLMIATSFRCGAVLISTTAGLTAGSCKFGNDPAHSYRIHAGSTTSGGDANQQTRRLNRILVHPKYSPAPNLRNDIAILYWTVPLEAGPTVRAISLPPQGAAVPYGKSCNVLGWGVLRDAAGELDADVLQVATVPLVTNEVCNQPDSYNGVIQPEMLCAGLPKGGRGPCSRDWGGPLVVDNVLFGITSWSKGCAQPKLPAVFTSVPFFNKWIRENLQ